jgi:DNA-binding MarR family transcriptional regulator
MAKPGWRLAVQLLLASRALFEELHARLAEAGHPGLRPAHGFVFQAVGARGATASELAVHLGVTKQAARLIAADLAELGYLRVVPDPHDARRRPLHLTARGRDALSVSARILDRLRDELAEGTSERQLASAQNLLDAIDSRYGPAPLRPVW